MISNTSMKEQEVPGEVADNKEQRKHNQAEQQEQ